MARTKVEWVAQVSKARPGHPLKVWRLQLDFRQRSHGLRPTKGDDKHLLFSSYSPVEAPPSPFVISTEAYPDFLLRAAGNDHVCGFP
jgi:hypothetical protein